MTQETRIAIDLTHAEALVLFEWLSWNDGALPLQDPSEQKVLWRIEAILEKLLPDPLAPAYADALATARKQVSDGE